MKLQLFEKEHLSKILNVISEKIVDKQDQLRRLEMGPSNFTKMSTKKTFRDELRHLTKSRDYLFRVQEELTKYEEA